nr:uncharacterized protein LOC111413872 isoform X2 [Onthophagus taurus]
MYIPRDGYDSELYNDYYNEWYRSISSREEYDNGDYSYDSSQAQLPVSEKDSNSFHNISSDGGDDNQKCILGPKVAHIYRNDIKVKKYSCVCQQQNQQQQQEDRKSSKKFCVPSLCSVCSKNENKTEKEKKVIVKRSGFLNELCHRKCAVVGVIKAQMRSLPGRMAKHSVFVEWVHEIGK